MRPQEGFAAVRDTILELFPRARGLLRGEISRGELAGELPLRAELFSAEQMQRHGGALARQHQLGAAGGRDPLLARLADNRRVLDEAVDLLTEAVAADRRITPAGEWLLDNYYLIEDQIRTARHDLPKEYSRELPRLANGPSAGFPRVYDIALEAISHGDGRVDAESLSRFVAAYQSETTLRIGELWAIPIMLRLALIENLRRVAAWVVVDRIDRNLADTWADRMTEIADSDPKSLILLVADMARSDPPMASSFVAELARRLQGQGASLALPLTWVEQWLSESGLTIEGQVQVENQQQAADQVSISNSIASLRFLAAMDWREFVETMSAVEQALRNDPAGVHGRMNFTTRDRYRHVIEELAKRSSMSELEVSQRAVELAGAHAERDGKHATAAHVGYFLVGTGRPQLELAIAARVSIHAWLAHTVRRFALTAYLAPIALLAVLVAGGMLSGALDDPLPVWVLGALAVLVLLGASELGVALVNTVATLLLRPQALPRMDFSKGIPSHSRTLVVVPTMLAGAAGIDQLAEALEVRFLANRDENLHFGLLTDCLDAAQESLAGDRELADLARVRIDELNQKYAPATHDRFFLFHRPRLWNAKEGAWMGYERKRGKLAALNALLRTGARDSFSCIAGETNVLSNIKYVITLDTDTQLPRDSAREFIGALAHPLNRPQIDAISRRVTAGYGILQPRVGVSLPGEQRSRYARLFGSESGIDPYTRAVSDVYQDLFGEGSFIGKGVYEIDAFERTLQGRFPEDSILSHDLLEGCHARAGLLSDVALYEEYPARYGSDVKRRHRWIRGDWQLLPWLLPRVKLEDSKRESNPLSALSLWKILDNLRRSLVPAALLALLLLGWGLLLQPVAWTLWVLAIVLVPAASAVLVGLFNKPAEMPLQSHVGVALDTAGRGFGRAAFTLACLPYEAWFTVDAVARTLWRLFISRRHLLEWSPFSEQERSESGTLAGSFRAMWFAPALGAGTVLALLLARPGALAAAAPIALLWLVSPALAWWLSRPRERSRARLLATQEAFLGRLARKNWAFFETCVGEQDHWLAPDNLQEHPVEVIAHRTSPTNIGLSLLANLAARDFGYISTAAFLERTAATLRTMQSMERHDGHFYNWYDTESLAPLRPRYVSAVDSGNLAGHLLTLRQGLLAAPDAPLLSPRAFEGLADTLGVLLEVSAGASPEHQDAVASFGRELAAARRGPPATFTAARLQLTRLSDAAAAIVAGLVAGATPQMQVWAAALARQCTALHEDLGQFAEGTANAFDPQASLRQLGAHGKIAELERLAQLAGDLAVADWGLLYDRSRHLLAIGYNAEEGRLDPGYYDLLASEARLASFVAIAQGQLPQESWFSLGRLLTSVRGDMVLLSWGGSMFEYLMPLLVMPSYEGTLLEQTATAAVTAQMAYGDEMGVPWGISESGYNTVDARLTYQYRSFGVPGMGLKRGLAQDLVIAPYASMMALMVSPERACQNLQRLRAEGCEGRFGFYEAVDYTPARQPPGQEKTLIRSFMAHHQAMGFLSLAYLLLDQPMQKRFAADPNFQATMLLLQERIPRAGAYHPNAREVAGAGPPVEASEARLQVFSPVARAVPAVQMLSNGRYHVMVTNAGGGYSRLNDMAVTRWREDGTRDPWGSFCYLRDAESGEFWSSSHQPTGVPVEGYEAIFSDMKAEFRGHKSGFDTHVEIAVSPEDDIELRRLRIINRSRTRRTIEITTYAEIVLGNAAADALHPAFGNLFVQTELVTAKQAILCTRRPRSAGEPVPWLFHLLAVHDADVDVMSYETDRSRFIGRGQDLARPHALTTAVALSNSAGSVLDPIVAIRCRITLAAEQSASIDMVSGIGANRESCLALIDKYRDRRLADRLFDLAWTHSQVVRRQIDASQADAQLYERLAAIVIHASPVLRAEAGVLRQNLRGQSGLWGHAISGDLPVVLVQISDPANIELVRRMVQAHAYWRLKGLAVDLVIWNEDQAGYRQQLQDQIMGLISAGIGATVIDRPGGIFVRSAQQISNEDRILLQSVARAIISDRRGSLAEQVGRRRSREKLPPAFTPATAGRHPRVVAELPIIETVLGNGLGGFSADGREYVIELAPGESTPAPWSNVIANPQFGTLVSESGSSYTWSENAHEFRLSPWHNDTVCDPSGEALYLRDEESGRVWSPTPLPRRGEGAYRTRHGFGYSMFEHIEDGVASELWLYVDVDAPVKFWVLKLRNLSGRARRLSATGYVEWVLGDLRAKSQMHMVTEIDAEGGALIARNPYNTEFAGRVAFFDTDETTRSTTCDRAEFLGRNGSMQRPAALGRARLSGRTGVALDPCAAIQASFALAEGESHEIVFRLGVGRDGAEASQLAKRMRGSKVARDALAAVRLQWERTLGAVQIKTPDPAIDLLANGWLMYQTLACRFWGRSGYYQSGGAYGFRDQLQDAMALVHTRPLALREHLLLCASHQFPEGDVQHWWHPPLDRGVRTRCSDDFLWLAAAACRYVEATGDRSVLDEMVHFSEARMLNFDEESYYDLPMRSEQRATLYEHCVRALQRITVGERGLPLIGSGDWNDGMNRVGHGGKGESVWLGFFLYDILTRFSGLARLAGDAPFVEHCTRTAAELRGNLERHAWDGAWYLRAWFDDGTPLGSAGNAECRIDSIAQSWSVLSGAGDPERSRQAMQSLDEHLVRREHGLVQLLDPPFGSTALDPGYIRGYVPGVRENGGQYTHAAIWAAMAFARLGDAGRAWELLSMINPVNHADSAERMATYKVEPYVMAADVYAVAPHIGRGGWTWYTGAAGWMYRLVLESLLGVTLRAGKLHVAPCVPADWPSFSLRYRHGESVYRIRVQQGGDANAMTIDGIAQDGNAIALIDDGSEHVVEIMLAAAR